MGHRLSKISTRTGDKGTTGLGNHQRVPKDHPRIEAIGAVDELNAWLGLLLTYNLPTSVAQALTRVQHTLFDLGGEIGIPPTSIVSAAQVRALEQLLEELNARLPPLKEFVLPGGTAAGGLCHLVRTACRRAERRLVSLAREETVNPESLQYLNRLSDVLFVMARILTREAGAPEVLWGQSKERP